MGDANKKLKDAIKKHIEEQEDKKIKSFIKEFSEIGLKIEGDSAYNRYMYSMSCILGFEEFLKLQDDLETLYSEMIQKGENE